MGATPNPIPVGSPPPAHTPPRRFTNLKGAAAVYGVSWRTWLRWADAGRVPWGVKIGGRRLWNLDELDRFIRDGSKPPKGHGARR